MGFTLVVSCLPLCNPTSICHSELFKAVCIYTDMPTPSLMSREDMKHQMTGVVLNEGKKDGIHQVRADRAHSYYSIYISVQMYGQRNILAGGNNNNLTDLDLI